MAKPEWGTKRMCPSCGQRFYDLNKSPMTCPSCEAEFSPDDFVKTRRGKATPTAPAPKPAKEDSEKLVKAAPDDLDSTDDDDEKTLDDDDDDADTVIEDTSDLGEDDDDLNEVREHIESDDDKKDS